MKKFKGILCACLWIVPAAATSPAEVIQSASSDLMASEQKSGEGSFWNYPVNYGSHYLSQTLLTREWMGRPYRSSFKDRVGRKLLAERLPDGSWKALKEANLESGTLDATIFNYWALKVIYGENFAQKNLSRTRSWIASRGGLDAAESPLKLTLCLFGNYTWKFIPSVPKMFFGNLALINSGDFALWLQGAILPVAYFKSLRLYRDLGPRFSLDELFTAKLREEVRKSKAELSDSREKVKFHILKMRQSQEPAGNWGASVVTTWLTAMALIDYNSKVASVSNDAAQIQRALKRIDFLMIENGKLEAFSAHDGHFWDTAWALLALGESRSALKKNQEALQVRASNYLVKYQSTDGGFAFDKDFLNHADADDTAVVIMALSLHGKRYQMPIARAVAWLEKIQNRDGGFPAFTRGVAGGWLTSLFLKKVYDPEYLFDRSTPDVTGHVLEALGGLGYTAENSSMVKRAQRYLLKNTSSDKAGYKMWRGRWGVNYIYGTSSAVSGLLRSGARVGQGYIESSLDWLESKQNRDGGLGESIQSYSDPKWAGKGKSTVTQTAWALMAWVDGGRVQSSSAKRAAEFLLRSYSLGGWQDVSLVGTGIPGLEYIDYPSYAKVFPLIALSRYQKALSNR